MADEPAARAALAAIAGDHPDATHVCWAWRLGAPPRERSHDAGEPRGTAGPPILRALRGADLSDALVAVVRWYGGTQLGKGGLARAYGAAAREALAGVGRARRLARRRLRLRVPYAHLGAVQRLVAPPQVEVVGEAYGESVLLTLEVTEERRRAVTELAAALRLEVVEE